MSKSNRREFLQFMGVTSIASTLGANIAKALAIPANNRTGTLQDVEHVVILMQENRPFDHHFGTLRGVRGFADPRAVKINLPLNSGTGTTPVPVWLQPAGAANVAAGFSVPPNYGDLNGPADGVPVVPPFRVNPAAVSPGLTSLGGVYLPGTDHGWTATHGGWNLGQYDGWVAVNGPMVVSYMTRQDLPYHYALADAFTIGDGYHSSIMGPTNPNRCYLWTGCVGNVSYLGSGGTDGHGAGPATYNGLSVNGDYWVWQTFPEVLQAAGISWKVYQDISGSPFSPDFGDATSNNFAGNYTDNPLLYFNQYATAPQNSALFQNACTGTEVTEDNSMPNSSAPESAWLAWQEELLSQFRSDVMGGTLPQVSWIVGPAGYTEHPDFPINYGAWYISQILDILVSKPEVFSKTVFIINYDEPDGSFDHLLPPTPPATPAYGASTVSIENEIVNDPASTPSGPIGLNCRVALLAISPWSKGGYVNSQVFDHTSVIRFIEKRFGVYEKNLTPWRRAVMGDLTSVFNFANPNDAAISLPSTTSFLPPIAELAGGPTTTFVPSLSTVILGVPAQEQGLRRARALPYELNAHGTVDASGSAVDLKFLNTGQATVVFQVRSVNPADVVRTYTVEPGKHLADTWNVTSSYGLSVYGPNGFVRYFNGSIGSSAAVLDVRSKYRMEGHGWDDRDWENSNWNDGGSERRALIGWKVTNLGAKKAAVKVRNAYTGEHVVRVLAPNDTAEDEVSLGDFHNWYDLIVTVYEDPSFNYRLAGHVETGRESFSDPALGGLVSLPD